MTIASLIDAYRAADELCAAILELPEIGPAASALHFQTLEFGQDTGKELARMPITSPEDAVLLADLIAHDFRASLAEGELPNSSLVPLIDNLKRAVLTAE